ncbi:MAG TPA: ABC transporter ATP-binding protein [Thermomicrobiales bacterium]|nr:ABC transporter ATP-binding protein [Thermomicrobiales bacterium]
MTVETRDLMLRYRETTALDGLSFALEGGKIYGLLGRNGSGKSTLLSVLAAFRKADEGDILIDGEPVFENPRVTRQIALIRENVDVPDTDDKIERVLEFAACYRPNWDADYAARLLDVFELDPKKKVKELSRGKQSALGAVLGLAARAPLTMFDETYLGMDAPSRYRFYDAILDDYIAHPRTIIISTHLIEEVARIFEEVVIIDKGRLVLHEPVETLTARGATVTGPAEQVEAFADGQTILNERQLGRTKSVMVYGQVTDEQRQHVRDTGLDLEPIALQDLFVYLTNSKGDAQ